VDPGDCQVVDVTFDSTGLAPDLYLGELLINSNDPDTPEFFVPVELLVEECGGDMFARVKMLGKMQGGAYIVNAIARVKDGQGNPIEGAEVTMFLKKPNAATRIQTRMTNPFGRVGFPMASPIGGYWLACIEDVQHPDFTWNDMFPRCAFLEFGEPPP
jgi:hypothetical protein